MATQIRCNMDDCVHNNGGTCGQPSITISDINECDDYEAMDEQGGAPQARPNPAQMQRPGQPPQGAPTPNRPSPGGQPPMGMAQARPASQPPTRPGVPPSGGRPPFAPMEQESKGQPSRRVPPAPRR